MFFPLIFSNLRKKFDKKVLRENDISILILDERWNSLFSNVKKTPGILISEKKLKDILKYQAKLTAENKEIAVSKKKSLDRIIKLTPQAYEKNDAAAKEEMTNCEKEVRKINSRLEEIEKELEEIPVKIKEANLELLEQTVNVVYFKMRYNQRRAAELEKKIEKQREVLKAMIDEKETLSQDYTEMYSYFHDLLGAEELQKMDEIFFKA